MYLVAGVGGVVGRFESVRIGSVRSGGDGIIFICVTGGEKRDGLDIGFQRR